MLERLVYCAASNPEEARKGRWLAGLLLALIALALGLVILDLTVPALSQGLLTYSVTFLILWGIYWANRQGYVSWAALAVLAIIIVALIAGSFAPGVGLEVLSYPAVFTLVISTAGVFITPRIVLLTMVLVSGITLWYYYYSPAAVLIDLRRTQSDTLSFFTYTMLILFLAIGALSWLSNLLIRSTLDDVRHRARELETAYNELAARSQREHALGADIGILAGQLSAVSTRQVAGVAAQSTSITEIVSSVAELHNTSEQIAALAQEVSHAADTALHAVRRAQDMVLHSRDAVQRNRVQVQQVIERMTALERLTARITGFVNSIRDLSDETQLLALNATIEAAGAGALGRRFGVVAAEVQKLSNRSNTIVDQIRGLISELQRAGEVTLVATQSSIAVANEVEGLADEVRGTQEQVMQAVQRTSELVHLISTATQQQNTAMQQMSHTMQEIADGANITTEETHALEAVSDELQRAAGMLMSAMQQLRAGVQRDLSPRTVNETSG